MVTLFNPIQSPNRLINHAHSPSTLSSANATDSAKYSFCTAKKSPARTPTAIRVPSEDCVKGKGEILYAKDYSGSHATTNSPSFVSTARKPRSNPPSKSASPRKAAKRNLGRSSLQEQLFLFPATALHNRNASSFTLSASFVSNPEVVVQNFTIKGRELETLIKQKEWEFVKEISTRVEDLERVYKMSPTKWNAELLFKVRELLKSAKKKETRSPNFAASRNAHRPWMDDSVTEFAVTKFQIKDESGKGSTEEDDKPTDRDDESPLKTVGLMKYLKDPWNGKIISKLISNVRLQQPKGDFLYRNQLPVI